MVYFIYITTEGTKCLTVSLPGVLWLITGSGGSTWPPPADCPCALSPHSHTSVLPGIIAGGFLHTTIPGPLARHLPHRFCPWEAVSRDWKAVNKEDILPTFRIWWRPQQQQDRVAGSNGELEIPAEQGGTAQTCDHGCFNNTAAGAAQHQILRYIYSCLPSCFLHFLSPLFGSLSPCKHFLTNSSYQILSELPKVFLFGCWLVHLPCKAPHHLMTCLTLLFSKWWFSNSIHSTLISWNSFD